MRLEGAVEVMEPMLDGAVVAVVCWLLLVVEEEVLCTVDREERLVALLLLEEVRSWLERARYTVQVKRMRMCTRIPEPPIIRSNVGL